MIDTASPIGVFDSGIGGLTVLKEITEKLPNENVIYLGDTARVPYGVKTAETVTKFSRQNSHFLIAKGVKLVVAACNTASAFSLETLKNELPVPVIGVIEPGANAAAAKTLKKDVGIIGTEGTINSNAYTKAIHSIDNSIEVLSKACPLFVPLTEEGWISHKIVKIIAEEYLSDLIGKIDVLVLGCTHYPLLKDVIGRIMGKNVILVDSAGETSITVEKELKKLDLLSKSGGKKHFYVSDNPERFIKAGRRFLGKNGISKVEKVNLEN